MSKGSFAMLQTEITQEGGIKGSLPAYPEAEEPSREIANQEETKLPALYQSEAQLGADASSPREEAGHDGANLATSEAAAPDSSTIEGVTGLEQALAAALHVS